MKSEPVLSTANLIASNRVIETDDGKWTQNENLKIIRSIGKASAGVNYPIEYQASFSGDQGGTSDVRAIKTLITAHGNNNIEDIRTRYSGVEISTEGGEHDNANVDHNYIWFKGSGSLNTADVNYGHLVTTDGDISLGRIFTAGGSVFYGNGFIDRVTGFYSGEIGDKGHVNAATGFHADDTNAASTVRGFLSEVSQGANKWNFYANGSADNYFSGKVGVGINSPNAQLHVDSGSDDIVAKFGSNGINSFITFFDDFTTGQNYVRLGATGDDLTFFTQTNERMRISSTGNVGIGSGQPKAALHIEKDTKPTLYINSKGLGGGRIILEDTDGSGCTEITTLNGAINSQVVACP